MRKGCLKVGCVEKVDSSQHNGITASIITRAEKIFSMFLLVSKFYSTASKNSPFDSLRFVNVANMLHEEFNTDSLTSENSIKWIESFE